MLTMFDCREITIIKDSAFSLKKAHTFQHLPAYLAYLLSIIESLLVFHILNMATLQSITFVLQAADLCSSGLNLHLNAGPEP